MDTWEYGYLYLCRTVRLDAHKRLLHHSPGPNIAVIRRGSGLSAVPYDDSVLVMNSLGAQGWIINDGVYVDSGAPNGVDAEIEAQGLAAWGYWSHFIRRQVH
jgi:hypothetical protein